MKSAQLLAASAAIAIAGIGGAGAPAATRTVTLGDDKTRYSYKAKDKPKTTVGILAQGKAAIERHKLRKEISDWNAEVEAKKGNKRARRAVVKASNKNWARQERMYGYES